MEAKIVQRFGNGGHIVLPKEYVGKRIRFVAEPKTFEDIKTEIFEILKPYLENIVGIYLYGSYARNEQTIDSDIDILVITNTKFKIVENVDNYHIISTTIEGIENTIKNNAVLIIPILKEAKTIINPDLLNRYNNYKFNKNNIRKFIYHTIKIIKLNKKGLELGFDIGSLVYSLILRIRGLLMIKLIMNNKLYSKSQLFQYFEKNNFEKNKISELYRIYTEERNNNKVKESKIIKGIDIRKLLDLNKELLKEIEVSLK